MLHPVPGVHLAAVGPDLVALDLDRDDYLCLPELGPVLAPGPPQTLDVSDAEMRAALLATGLFSGVSGPDPEPRKAPAAPIRSSRAVRVGAGRPHELLQMTSAVLHARRCEGRGVKTLTRTGPVRPRLPASEGELARRAVLFDRWLPWAPGQGRCLWRAFALRRFLRSGGLDAEWVFGVRTWPFSAHCWLQAGPLLLDDDLDRVGLYTPIYVA